MKKIGIVGWDTKPNESFGVTLPYMEWASTFGDVVIITPNQVIEDLDLLILPGGADVDTSRYGQMPGWYTGKPNIYLEHFDRCTLPKYIDLNIPVFGICRGMQSLSVFFGASLIQHLHYHETSTSSSDVEVHQLFEVRNDVFHDEDGFIQKSGKPICKIGSWHHQSVDPKNLGPNLIINLVSEDKVVESVSHRTLNVHGVQWHPERCYDEYSTNLVQQMLKK